jgi:hypothetical protein
MSKSVYFSPMLTGLNGLKEPKYGNGAKTCNYA